MVCERTLLVSLEYFYISLVHISEQVKTLDRNLRIVQIEPAAKTTMEILLVDRQ